jgi:hypothetical protein
MHKASATQSKITRSHFKPTLARRVMVFLFPVTYLLPIHTTVGVGRLIDCNCVTIYGEKAELSFFNLLPQCSEFPLQKMTIAEQVKKSPVHYESRCVFCVQRRKAHSHDHVISDFLEIIHEFKIWRKILNLRVWRRGRRTGKKCPHDCYLDVVQGLM